MAAVHDRNFHCYSYYFRKQERQLKKCPGFADLFTQDILLVPINIDNVHWTLLVVCLQEKLIQYFGETVTINWRYMSLS